MGKSNLSDEFPRLLTETSTSKFGFLFFLSSFVHQNSKSSKMSDWEDSDEEAGKQKAQAALQEYLNSSGSRGRGGRGRGARGGRGNYSGGPPTGPPRGPPTGPPGDWNIGDPLSIDPTFTSGDKRKSKATLEFEFREQGLQTSLDSSNK